LWLTNALLTALAWGVAQLVVICVLGKYLAAIVPVIGVVLFVVQRYYLKTSRQVRLLDIEAKAPLYTHFLDTIKGLSTIRAFRWEDAFHQRLLHILDESQKPFYMLFSIQQWLTLVLDLIVGFMAVVLAALAIFLTGSISAGALGVGLVLTLQFNDLLTQTIQAWTKLETSIGAVARVQQFVRETPAEPSGTEELPSKPWPEHGALEFHGITAAYT
jgi:ATP-binding cassette subfamily C (CFTR/MRP) protein 1